jgi:membrane protein involved in D-alanine export
MTPYGELSYFLIVLGIVGAMIVPAARGGVGWRSILWSTVLMLLVQYVAPLNVVPGVVVWELVALVAFGSYMLIIVRLVLARKLSRKSKVLVPLGLVPLVVAKYMPLIAPGFKFGFAGISYVTFRALDVLFALSDGVLAEVGTIDFFAFLFFFPTISSGPIDRFKRFQSEWRTTRNAEKFWSDFDAGIALVFQGLLYKFIIATEVDRQLLDHARKIAGIPGVIQYAYSYSAYLFFDFAGYSAFAIGVSRWFGISSPQNFNLPFLARNIRDFWNRWHMSLSFWFRDHVYTRFLLAAVRGKWFKKRDTAGRLGYFVSFGCMGVWHGLTWYYILYGIYHAVLFNVLDSFGAWKKKNPARLNGTGWKWTAHFLTVHAVIAGFWLFSGHGVVTEAEAAKFRERPSAPAEAEAPKAGGN